MSLQAWRTVPELPLPTLFNSLRRVRWGRTLNHKNGNGKDRLSVGAMRYLGRGIKSNRVIGATEEKQFQMTINPTTLRLKPEGGVPVLPEDIHRARQDLAGVVDHPSSKKYPLDTPENEPLTGLWGSR